MDPIDYLKYHSSKLEKKRLEDERKEAELFGKFFVFGVVLTLLIIIVVIIYYGIILFR